MTHYIEDKEIRGLSVKTIRWLIGCSMAIVFTIGGSYMGLQIWLDLGIIIFVIVVMFKLLENKE